MTTELMLLGWTLVLAIAQILLAAQCRTHETGLEYNMSSRDAPAPPMRPVTARLFRAQANLFETLPLFAAAVLIAHVAGREGNLTWWGAWIYLLGRIAYVPLYAFGVKGVRSIAWIGSMAGLAMILIAILRPV